MSLRANYFKLGVFVIGAVVAGAILLVVIGSGRWFQPRITIETYFNESVQGLDIGSKVKYRGVVIGEVTRISFTYVQYQLDKPMKDRLRYVLVQAQLQPKLLGGRAAAGDIASVESATLEAERGLRARLAPQGITGTSYLEIDYVEPPTPILPIDWSPENPYIPSTPSTVLQFVNAASEIIDRLHKLDIEGTVANFNAMLITFNDGVANLDTKSLSKRADRTLAKMESALDGLQAKKVSNEATQLLAEMRQTNAELRKTLSSPGLQKLPDEANAAIASVRQLVSDPKLAKSIADLERITGRMNRLFGAGEADLGTTIENLRQITDNLRDLTEETKRYPANVIFGSPPPPLERKK
jgi:ABC-type transporter Mla subunit MlaD